MTTTTIQLSESQATALEQLAKSSGKSEQDLMREAIDRMLDEAGIETFDWRAALRAGEGIWEQRTDLPDFDQVRREMDRELW